MILNSYLVYKKGNYCIEDTPNDLSRCWLLLYVNPTSAASNDHLTFFVLHEQMRESKPLKPVLELDLYFNIFFIMTMRQ